MENTPKKRDPLNLKTKQKKIAGAFFYTVKDPQQILIWPPV